MMRKAGLVLMMTLVVGISDASGDDASKKEALSTCRTLGEMARSIMTARQNGEAMSSQLAKIQADTPEGYIKNIVLKAYNSTSQYSTFQVRQKAIDAFAVDTEAACLSEFYK